MNQKFYRDQSSSTSKLIIKPTCLKPKNKAKATTATIIYVAIAYHLNPHLDEIGIKNTDPIG